MAKARASRQGWSEWQGLKLGMGAETLRLVLDDGQAFRWHPLGGGEYVGIWGQHLARLRTAADKVTEWCAPEEQAAVVEKALHLYLGVGADNAAASDRLPWRSDAHLAACMAAFPGLRLLRQPKAEALLCFLCSATKQIPQIKGMANALAARFGKALRLEGGLGYLPPSETLALHALPEWEALANADDAALRACSLGFRAANIKKTAQFLAAHPGWLEASMALPYAEAHARLTGLAGVGDKIADCALLYSGSQPEAFPVDTWILKVMARRYGLLDWKPEQVALFGRVHFGKEAGLAQQYLFNFERAEERAGRGGPKREQ